MKTVITVLAAGMALMIANPAWAQDDDDDKDPNVPLTAVEGFGGLHVELSAGWDHLNATSYRTVASVITTTQGTGSGAMFGGAIGYDLPITDKVLIGAELGVYGSTTKWNNSANLVANDFNISQVKIQPDIFIGGRVGFVLNRKLVGPGCTIFDVLDATAYVVPALEILDARMQRVDPETGRMRTVIDTISDNAANAAIVVGGRPFRPMETDLRWVAALCARNGIIEESGVAAAVLNHPARGIAWLANRLAAHEVALEPGLLILSGSFIRPVDARKGDVFHADYGPFGSISCRFT